MKKTLRAMIITGLTFVAAGTYCHASAADLALRAVKDVSGTVSVDTGSGVSVKVSAENTEAPLPSKPELVVVKEKDIYPENHECKGPDHVVIKEREIHPESIEHRRYEAIEHDRPSGRDRGAAVRDNMSLRGEHFSHNAEEKPIHTGDMHL